MWTASHGLWGCHQPTLCPYETVHFPITTHHHVKPPSFEQRNLNKVVKVLWGFLINTRNLVWRKKKGCFYWWVSLINFSRGNAVTFPCPQKSGPGERFEKKKEKKKKEISSVQYVCSCTAIYVTTPQPCFSTNVNHPQTSLPLRHWIWGKFLTISRIPISQSSSMEKENEPKSPIFKRICVFCGSSPGKKTSYKDAAIELGRELVKSLCFFPPLCLCSLFEVGCS